MQVSSFHFGPHHTPRLVKSLIFATALISILSPVLTFFFHHFLKIEGPQDWLSLSLPHFLKGNYWQPFTYFFIQSSGVDINFSLLFSLIFLLFLFWFTGSEILVNFGSLKFLLIYLGGGVVAGWVTLGLLFLFSSFATVTGSAPAIFALLAAWTLLYPDLELYFFFFLKIKAKWLVICIVGLSFLFSITEGAYFSLLAEIAGILWGVLCTLILKRPLKTKKVPREGKIVDIEVLKGKR